MTDENARDIDHAWELMKKIGFAMLVTRDGNKLRARPMSAYLERDNNAIYFLTDARRHKDEEISRNPDVNLSFADASSQKYVSLTGTAVVSNDRAKIQTAVFRRRRKLGGRAPKIPIFAFSKSRQRLRNFGILLVPSSLM